MSTPEGTHALIPLIGTFRAFLFHFALDILVNVNASKGMDKFVSTHVSERETSHVEGRTRQVPSIVHGDYSAFMCAT